MIRQKLDLNKNKYSMDVLKENIYDICLLTLLKTQKIDEEFAVNYILNSRFQLTKEEEGITVSYVLENQPHMEKSKLLSLFLIGPTDYDFPNFEGFQ